MDLNCLHDLERLKEQIFLYKPNINSVEEKKYMSDRLREQLVSSKAVVKIHRMDAECESLMISLKQRLMLLQDILIPIESKVVLPKNPKVLKDANKKRNLSSDSSDDETISTLISKQKLRTYAKRKIRTIEMQQTDTSESTKACLPLSLGEKPRLKKSSYKSYGSEPTSVSEKTRIKTHNNEEHALATSGLTLSSEEMLIEQEEVDKIPTLHIKIPSLHRENVHYIILDSLNFARKVFDNRANEIRKKQLRHSSISQKIKISNPYKKHLECTSNPFAEQLAIEEHELELSQLIKDVMSETCGDETVEASSALENINRNLYNCDNNGLVANDVFINYWQSSQELPYYQNTNANIEKANSTSENNNLSKETRKNTKRIKKTQPNEPPKKRGRKPKNKNDSDTLQLQAQSPTKSNLAKYLELFSSNCELLPGSSTPTASSTRSQPLVSSTTHSFDMVGLLPQQQQLQTSSQQPITYYIDGDWANGGMCQLVPTNCVSVEERQLNRDNINTPFQHFVNYIDSSVDSGNNSIARVLEPITNLGYQNKNHQQFHHQSRVENSLVPIINIPTLPNNITSSSVPPPAHVHKEILDLSIKSKPSVTVISTDVFNQNRKSDKNIETFHQPSTDDENCLPLDLSTKVRYTKEKHPESNCITIDTQEENFIRHLIEQNEFDYSAEEIKKKAENSETIAYDQDNKSFEAALDMPLLALDGTDLGKLVEHGTNTSKKKQKVLTDDTNIYNDATNNEDSNYVSMTDELSSIENNLQITDQSTTEIFTKIVDISPDNQFLYNNMVDDDLNETVFDQHRVENSTMCEVKKNTATEKDQLEGKKVCQTFWDNDQQMKNISNDEPSSSTSLAAQFNSSNANTDMSNMSLNLSFSDDNASKNIKKAKFKKTINVQISSIVDVNSEICNNVQQSPTDNEKENILKIISKNHRNDQDANAIHLSLDKKIENDSNTIFKKDVILKLNEKNRNDIENINAKLITNNNIQETSNEPLSEGQNDNGKSLLEISSVKTKSKENIVFSIPKIYLSEDDNLFATDSDSSSGKSFELSEHKPLNTDANLKKQLDFSYNRESDVDTLNNGSKFIGKALSAANSNGNFDQIVKQNLIDTTVSESFEDHFEKNKEYLNIYNKEVKKLPNAENNLGQELIDISKKFEYTKVEIDKGKIKDILFPKNSNITNESLTILELESKLEAPLDYDEDLDDALSLATSCFDSPIDERYEDSIVDIDKTTTTNTPQDNSSYHPEIEDFKHFKIPKISNLTVTGTTMVSNNEKEIKFGDTTPIYSNTKLVSTTNIEKITRIVKNDSTQINISAEAMETAEELEDETTFLEKFTLKVFGISCFACLVDKCFAITNCTLSHQFSDTDKVYKNLNNLNKTEVNLAYQVLYNHSKLFKAYFEVFCIYYSTKNDRLKLLNMANDCERYPEHAEFIIAIYEALVKCGLSRDNACRLLLKRVREKSNATSIIEALVAIIMKSDWTMFTDFIEKYTRDIYKFNFRIGILEQMAPAVLNSKGPHLKQVFGKCVQTLHCDDTSLLLSYPTLIQCVALLTTNTQ